MTRQRRAIQSVFEQIDTPLSPQEILEHSQQAVPELGLATVYRTLRALLDEALVSTVELPGEPLRYERAGRGHHHHFQCRGCSRVFEVRGCPGNLPSITPQGFRLERHELVLYGLCEGCAA